MVKKATRMGYGAQGRRDADQAKIDAFTGDNDRTSRLKSGLDTLRDAEIDNFMARTGGGSSVVDSSSSNTNVMNLQYSGPVVTTDPLN